MLPDPKKVARVLNRTLFKSKEERREEDERIRDVQVRVARTQIRRHIQKQKEMEGRLKALAKRALSLGEENRFKQVGRQLLWTEKDVLRWEKYLLTLEILQARRDQARASIELLSAVKVMSESLNLIAEPQKVGELQLEIEQGLAKASSLEDRMAVMMEMMDETLSSDLMVDDESLSGLEDRLGSELAGEEAAAFDREIEEGLRKIRDELQGSS